jgi:hypothetical protein
MAVLAMRNAGDPREVIDAFASTTRETGSRHHMIADGHGIPLAG